MANRTIRSLLFNATKKILNNKLHARDMLRQKNEAMIGCGILNKMTHLGMPKSYRCA